jgi:hypothetical protein
MAQDACVVSLHTPDDEEEIILREGLDAKLVQQR